MKVLKAIWWVFESICFAIGLFFVVMVLTNIANGGKVSITKDGEQVYCLASSAKYDCSIKGEDK